MDLSSPSHEDFSARLRKTREQKGLSQAELAEKSGFQPSAISHFETGRRAPSFDNLKRLADALSVSTDYLLGRETEPGFSGPMMQRMFRHAEKLSESDLETLEEFAKMLARKNKPPKNEDGL